MCFQTTLKTVLKRTAKTHTSLILQVVVTNLPVIGGVGIRHDVSEGGGLLARVAQQHVAARVEAVLRHAHHVRAHVCTKV